MKKGPREKVQRPVIAKEPKGRELRARQVLASSISFSEKRESRILREGRGRTIGERALKD